MALTKQAKQTLQQRAHHLQPVVIIGSKGLTSQVQQEIDSSLEKHELIKIKLPTSERAVREQMINSIATEQAAEVIQHIGRVVVIYRDKENL